MNELIKDAEILLKLKDKQAGVPLFDQAVYFSLLRGLCSEASINWPTQLMTWLENQSQILHIPLLR